MNAHISPYSHGNRENHEPTRTRKLLLHKKEIDKLSGKAQEKGLTLVPTKMYFKNGRLKLELAVAKGKKLYDKRESEKRREADREARAIAEREKPIGNCELRISNCELVELSSRGRFGISKSQSRNSKSHFLRGD